MMLPAMKKRTLVALDEGAFPLWTDARGLSHRRVLQRFCYGLITLKVYGP
jgi:hypothetical protein